MVALAPIAQTLSARLDDIVPVATLTLANQSNYTGSMRTGRASFDHDVVTDLTYQVLPYFSAIASLRGNRV